MPLKILFDTSRKTKPFTPFELKVYKVISKIPLGQTRSYSWVARQIGSPKAARAVGNALNKNPYPLLIPCHRIVNSDGSLGGYALGKEKKRTLLRLEKEISA